MDKIPVYNTCTLLENNVKYVDANLDAPDNAISDNESSSDAYKPKSNIGMSQKQVMPKSEDLSRSLEINAIWTFDTEFPTIFNKSCTYITFKSAVKHRQLGYGYPRGQTVHLAEATTQDTYSSI